MAYTFADANRGLLSIPDHAQFQVLPRLVVTKDYYVTSGPEPTPVTELLFKVRWSETEANPPELGDTPTRRIQTGTTLVIDWDKKVIRACLHPLDLAGRRRARDAMLRRLMARGFAQVSSGDEPAAAKRTVGTGIEATVTNGVLRVKSTARLLHLVKDADDE
jgi:hypothetical protein